MFRHRLGYWKWSWCRLWLVVWVPCREKCKGLSGHRSAVLAQILQKCIWCSNCLPKCVERSLYDSPTISQTLWIVCLWSARIASRTFAMFSGVVLGDRHPEHSYRRQTFVRPWSVCAIKKFCFGSWHYLRRLPVAFGGFLQQVFKSKQNFMQILFSLKSVISVVKKNR